MFFGTSEQEVKMLDLETIRKINDGLLKEKGKRDLADWQWEQMLRNESNEEDWN